MSCSALGSILKKLCDSCSCIFGTLCNCSHHNQVMMVVGRDESRGAENFVSQNLGEGPSQEVLNIFRRASHDPSIEISLSQDRELTSIESRSERDAFF